MSKPNSKAKLLNLPEEQQAEIADWLLGGMPYYQAQILAKERFGVDASSSSTWSSFWEHVCEPLLIVRRQRMSGTASIRAEEAKKNPAQFQEATLDALQQRAYALAENPNAPAKEVKAVLMLLLKAEDQSINRERLAFERQKYQDTVAAANAELKKLRDPKADMTDNERNAVLDKVDEILGLK